MAEKNVDISNNKVKLFKETDVENAEKVIVMCKKELCPDFLINSSKVSFWKIKDPYKEDTDSVRKIRDFILKKVKSIL